MEELCSATRNIGRLCVLAQFNVVHLLLHHVVSKPDEVKVRRYDDASLLHKLATEVWKDLKKVKKISTSVTFLSELTFSTKYCNLVFDSSTCEVHENLRKMWGT